MSVVQKGKRMYTNINVEVKTELSYTGFFSAGNSLKGKWTNEDGRIKFFDLVINGQGPHEGFEASVSEDGVPSASQRVLAVKNYAVEIALCKEILPTVFIAVLLQLNKVNTPPDICNVLHNEKFRKEFFDILDKIEK